MATSPDLEQLEQELRLVYSRIAEAHGLSNAMQALGRLMLAGATFAAPPATAPQPAAASAASPEQHRHPHPHHTPLPPPSATQSGASPFGSLTPLEPNPTTPTPIASIASSVPPPAHTTSDEPGGNSSPSPGPGASPGQPSPILQHHQQQQQLRELAPSHTLESIRTMPSATLSQMPSGVLSLISPSDAGDPDHESESEKDGSPDVRQDKAAGRAKAADLSVSVPVVNITASASGVGAGPNGGAGAAAGAGGLASPGADKVQVPVSPAGGVLRLTPGVLRAAARMATAGIDVPQRAAAKEDGGGAGAAGEAGSPSGSSALSLGATPKSGSLWHRAVHLTKAAQDPWAARNLHTLPMERCTRQRYNPHTGQWVTDEVLVKMEAKPFAAGAMRECYAAKQLSTFTHSVDWHKANNVVAKRYKKEGVRRGVYYNDLLVQMDAKMLGEMYNRTDPPKQVDVMQCVIVQFTGRPKAPLYCMEQLIEGDYVKYNSNSGFVQGDDLLRNTPHAFSHFTWELTKGLKICVDVQGVGDLYTDPQLHTLDGEGYGEGNLGLRGMALFFRTHECNALCRRLGLNPFERCEEDIRSQGYSSERSSASASGVRPGGTLARTMARAVSWQTHAASERKRRQAAAASATLSGLSEEALLAGLQKVPRESPEALVHMEIAKLYGEVVLLPELKPNEDPEDCLRGGLFHLHAAARLGCLLALLVLARAHCGIEASAPQFSQLFKVASKQRDFRPFPSVAWRCVRAAAEAGVRGAALCLAYAYGTGQGLLGQEVLGGDKDPAQAAKWFAAALALPDVLAEAAEAGAADGAGDGGAIAEEDEEDGEGEEEDGAESDDTGPEMSGIRPRHGRRRSGFEDNDLHVTGLSELDLERALSANLAGLRVPKLEELRPSRAFLAHLKVQAEEEAAALPGAAMPRYEVLFHYGCVLMEGGEGLEADPARAAELLEEAAEEAGAAGKGKLAQRYYEKAAEAQGMCE